VQFTIHRHRVIDSTNNLAICLAEEGAPGGTVVVAEEQLAGRGRVGRTWCSPPGYGLYLSLILRPEKPVDQLWQTAYIASVAVAETIKLWELPARIKWPNDILINGRKVSGILIEAKSQIVVVGIGINVNTPEFPPEISSTATSMLLESHLSDPIDLQTVECKLLSSLDLVYALYSSSGFEPVLDLWKGLECTTGRHVVVNVAGCKIAGTAESIDEKGDLVVRTGSGESVSVSSGEVIFDR